MRPIKIGLTAAAAVMIAAAPVGTAYADPPPWAPAHGWRAKQDKQKKREDVHVDHHSDRPARYRQPVIVQHGQSATCDRTLLTGNKTLLAQVLGGAGGAVAGAQFGQGTGKLAATAGGALLGVLIGTEVGRSLDAADAACVQESLEFADIGQPVAWRNPDAGAQYSVVPTRTYQASGTYCREYTTLARIGDRSREASGTACRQPDGTWRIAR